jgi:hypothetical protein
MVHYLKQTTNKMESLLGQFYSRIRGSQENIASEGLVYVLNRSKAAREALNNIIRNDCGLDFPDLNYEAQSTGKNLERPDILCKDERGNNVLILEAKFWSALTENQPVAYLDSLVNNSLLMFICPGARVRPVFTEINNRLKSSEIITQPHGDWHLKISDQNKHIIVKKWPQILEPIKDKLSQEKENDLLADINQIIGLCDIIDNTAFLPLQSDDLSPKYARRVNNYFDVIDNVVEELKKRKRADTKSLRAAGPKYAYVRYFKMNQLGVSFQLRFDLWGKVADTPFWIIFKDILSAGDYWRMSEDFRNNVKNAEIKFGYTTFKDSFNELYFALPPLLDVTGDEVIKDMANKIIDLSDELTKDTITV